MNDSVIIADKFDNALRQIGNKQLTSDLKAIPQHMYRAVRDDISMAEPLIDVSNKLIDFFLSINYSDIDIYNRLLSFISFKYDILLQKNTTVEIADKYLEEVKFIMNKKAYLVDPYNVPKIAQCISKIQFVYNITNSDKNIRDLYVSFLSDITNEGMYKDIAKELNTFGHLDSVSPAMPWIYYILYREDIKELIEKRKKEKDLLHPYFPIIQYWKGYKVEHYDMTWQEFFDEGFETYNFIYRE
jgi:hypothetical protein